MYWTIREAVREFERRSRDTALAREVQKVIGDFPVAAGRNAFLFRHIATARYEDILFHRTARSHNLRPIWLEYLDDKYHAGNPSKLRLAKICVRRPGHKEAKNYQIIKNPGAWDRACMREMKTNWGESLVGFHHRVRHCFGLGDESVCECSDWVRQSGGRAKEYYTKMLALGIQRGIIFESFESANFGDLENFKKNVVLPAFKELCDRFPSPIIVLHPPAHAKHERLILNCYPQKSITCIPQESAKVKK